MLRRAAARLRLPSESRRPSSIKAFSNRETRRLKSAPSGGIVIGVAQALGAAVNPEWQILSGHIAFVLVLLLRPRGLFPRAND